MFFECGIEAVGCWKDVEEDCRCRLSFQKSRRRADRVPRRACRGARDLDTQKNGYRQEAEKAMEKQECR